MRAKEFITEFNSVDASDYEGIPRTEFIQKVADDIRRDCGPFINANRQELQQERFLYRGIKGTTAADLVVNTQVRWDRKPRDTVPQWHAVLDSFFQREFGWKYRSASMFATNCHHNTVDYGRSYIVFPKGNYKMCYSPIVEDVTVDLAGDPRLHTSPVIQDIIKAIPEAEYKAASKKFDMVINDWSEFYTALLDFSAGRVNNNVGEEFIDNFPIMLSYFLLPKLGYVEGQQYAVAGESEVMVQCSEYYGIAVRSTDPLFYQKVVELILQ